jgi:glycosyltransferase involved in cell wall biosynthesis
MLVVMIGHKGVPSRSGGIERHVEELSAALAMRGVRVISYDRKWYVGDAAPVRGVLRRFSRGIRTKHLDAITNTFTAIIMARRDKPDVIHIHGVGPALLAPLARVLHPRARLVITFHCVDRMHAKWGAFARCMLHAGERFACTFAHRTITVSNGLAAYCLNQYECQSAVIPNGVRVLNVLKDGIRIVEGFGLKPKKYFAMVTRLIPHKNAHVAIEAHKMLARRRPGLAREYPLVIIGGGAFTDEYERELKSFAETYPHALFTGEQSGDALAALQENAAAHLSVSSSEGMSISLLESMAMSRPAIVSDIPENLEVVEQDALVVRANDAACLSRAMECVLDMEDEERDAMGMRLRDRVLRNHDWDVIAERTKGIYEEVCLQENVGAEVAMHLRFPVRHACVSHEGREAQCVYDRVIDPSDRA